MKFRDLILAGAVLVLLAASPTLAGRVDVPVQFGGGVNATVDEPGEVTTYSFLVSKGTKRNVVIVVKPARRSTVQTTVRLFDPNGVQVDPAAVGGFEKLRRNVRTIKLPNIDVGGLWRVEVTAVGETLGGYGLTVKGRDVASAKGAAALPGSGFLDVPIEVGANQAITVKARRGAGSRVMPQLRILDATGTALESGSFLGFTNSKGVFALKKFRLAHFGRYTLRFSDSSANGGAISYAATAAPAVIRGLVPTANPGPSTEADPAAPATLNGLASTGSVGTLSYRWAQIAGPAVSLTGANSATPTYVAPTNPTTLVFELAVSESGLMGRAVPLVVEVARRPIADAGRSLSVATAALVTLDGSSSTNRGAGVLAYSWTQNPADALQVTLTGADTATPTFTAPATPDVLRFRLKVDDGIARSLEDEVVVVVGDPARPVADAGRTQVVQPMSTVFLSGLASSLPDGVFGNDFEWVQVSGPPVTLEGATTAFPTFTAHRTSSEMVFDLIAGGDAGTKDTVRVRVLSGETGAPPQARGSGVHISGGGNVSMSALNSTDPNAGDPLTHRWAQTDGLALTPSALSGASVNLSVPAGSETRSYAVQVNDRLAYSPPDLVHVRNTGFNVKPVAAAGIDIVGQSGQTVFMDGRGSSASAGGSPVTYLWRQVSGRDWYDIDANDATFDPTVAQPRFTLPSDVSSLASRRTITFALVVNDGTATSAPDYMTVSFAGLPTNGAPTVTASADVPNPIPAQVVRLTAVPSDRDGDPVTVRWTQVLGPTVSLTNSTSTVAQFTAPASGSLRFRVTPSDPFDDGTPAEVSVNVNQVPTARTRVNPTFGPPGTDVTVDGLQSTDPEGATLTYAWTQTAGPAVTFDSSASSFSFVSASGTYSFRLVVNDGRQNSLPSTVGFSGAQPPTVAPTASAGNAPYGSTVNLQANASGGGTINYTWRVISATTGISTTGLLSSTTSANTSFTVPLPSSTPFGTQVSATFGVIANNGTASPEGTVTVNFYASFNDNASGTVSGAPSTTTYVMQTILQKCATSNCHSGTSSTCSLSSGYGMGTAASFRTNNIGTSTCAGGKGSVRIQTSSSSGSYFFQRLTGQATPQMPTTGSLSTQEKNVIQDWIDQGALDN